MASDMASNCNQGDVASADQAALDELLQPEDGEVFSDIDDVPDDDLLLQWARDQFVNTSADALRADGNENTVNDSAVNDSPQSDQELAAANAAQESDDDDLGAPLVATSEVARARVARLTSAAAPAAAAAMVTQFQTWRERAVGTSPVPSPINPDGTPNKVGMAHISKGEGLDECPWPCPDSPDGVSQKGLSMTAILKGHAALFEPWGFGQITLDHIAKEAAEDSPIGDDIAIGNQHHSDTNPTGFPSAEDRTIKCRDFLLLRTGETNGCSRWCRVFRTKNPPRRFKVAVGCAFRQCPGHRSMTHNNPNLGSPGMLLGVRVLIEHITKDLSRNRDSTHEVRLGRCINILMKHPTLLLAWLKYEAYIALKENELSLSYTPATKDVSKGARKGGGKARPKGGKKGNKGGSGSGKGGRGGRIGTPPVRAVPETPQARSGSSGPSPAPTNPRGVRPQAGALFTEWAREQRTKSRGSRGGAGRGSRDDRSVSSGRGY